jgi:hypothetical protein
MYRHSGPCQQDRNAGKRARRLNRTSSAADTHRGAIRRRLTARALSRRRAPRCPSAPRARRAARRGVGTGLAERCSAADRPVDIDAPPARQQRQADLVNPRIDLATPARRAVADCRAPRAPYSLQCARPRRRRRPTRRGQR